MYLILDQAVAIIVNNDIYNHVTLSTSIYMLVN